MTDAEAPTPETVAAAETLLGIRYTEAERALIAPSIGAQIALAVERRGLAFPETLAPAGRFDPRLPGWTPPAPGPFRPAQASAEPLPESDADIAFAPLTLLSRWIRDEAISSVRLTELYLDRIAGIGPRLECFPAVAAERALAEAHAADKLLAEGTWLGPLHGIPWGAKDLLDTAGIPTGWGAEPFRDRIPAEDCRVVSLLAAAGAVLVAKTAVGALAYGDVWYGGRSRNPWNIEEGSSGSSAGSGAATAAGLLGFAIGTETGGSIIAPAMRCGTVGLRPTFGRVSRIGVMPLAWSLDKIGVMCRGVEDSALVLDVINGFDERDPGSIGMGFAYDAALPVAGLRLGYFPEDFEAAETPDLDRAALETARGLGLDLVPLTRPNLPYLALRSLMFAEAAACFEQLTLTGRDEELRRQDIDAWPNEFRKARFLSAVDHVQLDRFRRRVMEIMDDCFRGLDAVIGPSMVGPMLTITNYTGHPSLVLPSGFIRSPTRGPGRGELQAGLEHEVPHGISLWAPLFAEGKMLSIGLALERAFGLGDRRPPFA
jgi:Asp-tRNA(Asn)/Glu-tRNA(Gln) amidotransferase A subunit family amidase